MGTEFWNIPYLLANTWIFFFSFLKKLLSFHSKEALAFVPSLWGGGVGAGIFSLLPLLGPFGRSINEIGVRQTKRRKI